MPMDEPRELELKYHLGGEKDYALLVEGLSPAPGRATKRQENYYFDSPAYDLAEKGGMLRLRFDGELKLCFKLGGEKPGHPGYFDALEVESAQEPGFLREALAAPEKLTSLNASPITALWRHFKPLVLVKIGELTTVRRYRLLGNFLLELDQVIYPDGCVTYEVEIETPSPEEARQLLLEKFTSLGIEAAPQKNSKLKALLKHMGLGSF